MSQDPPCWKPKSKRDEEAMVRWVNERLDDLLDSEVTGRTGTDRYIEWLKNDGPQIWAAERGDLDPLRKLYPHLAPYLHRRKRSRGKYLRKASFDPVKAAIEDIKNIRLIWKQQYKTKHRKRDDKPSAVDIAVGRWKSYGVTPNKIANRLKR
jgi:hypothetical protein